MKVELLKVFDHGLLVLIGVIVLYSIQSGSSVYSNISQEVTVLDLNLSTWSSSQYVKKDIFFDVYMNLTMPEWIDHSGTQNPAIIQGPVLEVYHGTVGFAFDGKDDVVIVPNSRNLNSLNELTIEVWTRFYSDGSSLPGRDWFTLLCKGSRWGNASYCLLTEANSTERCILFILNGVRAANAKTFMENHMWYHIVATFNGSFAMIFLNGELVANAPFDGNLTNNNEDLYIGSERGDIYPLNGLIGSLRIHDRALSQDEIRFSYERKPLMNSASLVLDLNFENLKYIFQKSEDGLDFHEAFQNNVYETVFSWKENQSGRYVYRIAMPSVENNSRIIHYSNRCVVDIVPKESQISLSRILYAFLLVSTVVICLYRSQKNKGAKD